MSVNYDGTNVLIRNDSKGKVWIEALPELISGHILLLKHPDGPSLTDILARVKALRQQVPMFREGWYSLSERLLMCQDLFTDLQYRVRLNVLAWMDQVEMMTQLNLQPDKDFHVVNPFELQNYNLQLEIDDTAVSLMFEDEAAIRKEISSWLSAAILWLGWSNCRSTSLPILCDVMSGSIRMKVEIAGCFSEASLPAPGQSQAILRRNIALHWAGAELESTSLSSGFKKDCPKLMNQRRLRA